MVKARQKEPAAKKRWQAYCDLHNHGTFDPARAPVEMLDAFKGVEETGCADFSTSPLFDQLLIRMKA
eukprot:5333066-Prorocentrum_lima.AAC.1